MNNFAKNLLLVSTLLTVCGTTESWGQDTNKDDLGPQKQKRNGGSGGMSSENPPVEDSITVTAHKPEQAQIELSTKAVDFYASDLAEKSIDVTLNCNSASNVTAMFISENGGMQKGSELVGYTVVFDEGKTLEPANISRAKANNRETLSNIVTIDKGKFGKKLLMKFNIDKDNYNKAKPGDYIDTLTISFAAG